MSICPVRDDVLKFMVSPTPVTSVVNPPLPRDESCGVTSKTTVISGGTGSTSTTVTVAGPPGPQGPEAEFKICMKWEGDWTPGMNYTMGSVEDKEHVSVVKRNGVAYVALVDHESSGDNYPYAPDEEPHSDLGFSNWTRLVEYASGTDIEAVPPDERDFLTKMKDGIFDWVDKAADWAKNATLGDWLLAGALAAGVIWAGSKIVDKLTSSGDAPSTKTVFYTGSPGYNGAIEGTSLKALLISLCEYCGVNCDVSSLIDSTVSMPINNNPKVVDVIQELANVYQFDRVDSGGVLKFVPRNATPVRTIYLKDIGYSGSTSTGSPIVYKREQGITLPRQVTVTYVSVAQDYGRFGQTSQLLSFESGNEVTVSTVITLDDTFAKTLADITLVNANLQRSTVSFTGTLDQVDLQVGDVVVLETFGPVRILTIDENDDGMIDFVACDAGSPTNIAYSTATGVVVAPIVSNNVVTYAGYSDTFFIDLPVLDSTDTGVRIFAATHGYGKAGWPGAKIYKSGDGGNTYQEILSIYREATWGMAAAALPTADYQVWDDTNTIEVTLKTGQLSTAPDASILNGANRAMIGREMIAFGTATLIGPKQYRLSHILRGLQGTDAFVDTHETHELFVMVDNLVKISLTADERKKIIKYKTVTIGHDISDSEAVDVECYSNNLTPWRVSRPIITKAGNDYNLTWGQRCRYENSLKDGAEISNEPDFAGFSVAVLDGTSAIKRVWTGTSKSWTYTAAMQITDFGSLQTSVKMSITQLSKDVGGGYPTVINSI